jgi:apolipoprotein N-acyltransferase
VTGVWGIAFWLALFNALVALAVSDWRAEETRGGAPLPFRVLARRLAKVFALMLLPPLAYSAFVFIGETRRAQSGREISALLVQTNLNPYAPLDGDGAAYRIGRAAALTRRALSEGKPDLVVWPEGTVLQLWSLDSEARNNVRREVARWQTPLLTGVIDARRAAEESRGGTQSAAASYEFFNGAVMLTPSAGETQGAGNTSAGTRDVRVSEPYYRRVLMPFVERVPYKERFPFSHIPALRMDETSPELTPGQRATVFDFPDRGGRQVTTAAVICYEQLYPAETAEFVRGGAQVLAFLTNQGWFSKTHGPYELAALSRIRSIETRRTALRAANTGVTWVVDAYGRVQAEVPWWSEQTLRVDVRLSDELTLYVRYTDYLPKACLCVSLALFLAAAWKRMRLRPRATEHVVGELKI